MVDYRFPSKNKKYGTESPIYSNEEEHPINETYDTPTTVVIELGRIALETSHGLNPSSLLDEAQTSFIKGTRYTL